MGFLDDLKEFLDSTLGPPGAASNTNPLATLGSGALGDLTPPTLDFKADSNPITGIRNQSLDGLETWPDQNRTADPGVQAGILQHRKNAFNVIDIDPPAFAQSATSSIVKLITDKVGIDGDYLKPFSSILTQSAWRTITLGVPGTSLTFESIPIGINKPLEDNVTGIADVSNKNQTNIENDTNTTGNVQRLFQTKGVPYFLVQFDDPNGPLITASPGDAFQCAFNTVYISFKWYAPKFSVIFGSGATMVKTKRKTDLALGSFLFDDSNRHATPFCFTDADQSMQGALGQAQLAANSSNVMTLFDPQNVQNPPYPTGVSIGWITSISFCSAQNTVPGTSTFIFGTFYVYIANGANSTTVRKLLCSVPIVALAGNSNNNYAYIRADKAYSIPVRFTLYNDNSPANGKHDTLCAAVFTAAGNPGNMAYKFTVEGYMYGIAAGQKSGTSFGQWPLEALANNPFPSDLPFPAY